MKFKGGKIETEVDVHIGRYSGSTDNFYIEISDRRSGCRIVDVTISPKIAADLFSNRTVKGQGEVYTSNLIGKKMENKTVHVPIKYNDYTNANLLVKEIDQFVKNNHEGWEADTEQSFNFHMWNNNDKTYSVTIRRWVKYEFNKNP